MRLEKIEFSGVRGQVLSDLVAEMFTEFTELSNQFQSQAKEPLNISNTVGLPAVQSYLIWQCCSICVYVHVPPIAEHLYSLSISCTKYCGAGVCQSVRGIQETDGGLGAETGADCLPGI